MAMAASLSPRLASSSYSPKQKYCSLSISLISNPKFPNVHFSNCIPQLGIFNFSTWNGLRHLNSPTSRFIVKLERKKRCKGVCASLFGVGAPEALVIGVVALLVFGPKGLAEVARNLGKTLRDFQPTIRELQEVSRDFKSTLEREIGLDEIQETTKPTTRTKPTANAEDFDFVKPDTPSKLPPLPEASLAREDVKISEEQVEATTAELQVTDGSVLSKESETQEYLKQLEEQVQALLAEKQSKSPPATTEVKSQDTSFSTETSSIEDNVETKEQELEEVAAQKDDDTSFSTEASFTEDNVKTKEQELEEVAAQKNDDTTFSTEASFKEDNVKIKEQELAAQENEDTSFSTEVSFTEDNIKTKEHELQELASQKHEEVLAPTESQTEPQSQSEGAEVTWTTNEAETQEYLKKLEKEVQELLTEKQKQTLTATAEVNPEDTQEAASVSSPSQNPEKQA